MLVGAIKPLYYKLKILLSFIFNLHLAVILLDCLFKVFIGFHKFVLKYNCIISHYVGTNVIISKSKQLLIFYVATHAPLANKVLPLIPLRQPHELHKSSSWALLSLYTNRSMHEWSYDPEQRSSCSGCGSIELQVMM